MFDEMNLQHHICTSTITGEVVGFASSDESFACARHDAMNLIKEMELNKISDKIPHWRKVTHGT